MIQLLINKLKKLFVEVKIKIVKWSIKLVHMLFEESVINLFNDLKNYKNDKKSIFLFFIFLPLTFIFIVLNIMSFLFCFVFYVFNFFLNIVKSKWCKNKNRKFKKIIKFRKRFKFLKQYHIIILEKIFLTFPKKKAFLFFYIILKKIYKKENFNLDKEFIFKWLKAVSNRYFIVLIIGVPYIVLYCNKELVKTIRDLEDYTYTDKIAYIDTVILNVYKNLIPDYNKIIEKLKIIITEKKVNFNSKKEIIKSLKLKKEFNDSFEKIKKNCVFALAKQITDEKNNTKYHPTIILKTKKNLDENNTIYLNETSNPELKVYRFNSEVQKYIEYRLNNNLKHCGSIKKEKCTYYTPPIETQKKNIIIERPSLDQFIKNDISNENINNIAAGLTVNLNSGMIQTKKIKIDGIEKNKLIKEKTEKSLLTWVKENKESLTNELFESLLKINCFWEENEIIIKEMSIENKIELSKTIGMELKDMGNVKEVNFKIFTSFIKKDV